MRQKRRQIERRFVVEAVNYFWPQRVAAMFNFPLGQPPKMLTQRYPGTPITHFRRWRRYADAIVVLKRTLILVEAKIHSIRKGVGDLDYYAGLVPQTPELQKYAHLPLVKALVAPYADDGVVRYAAERNVRLYLYMPPWVEEYLREVGVLA